MATTQHATNYNDCLLPRFKMLQIAVFSFGHASNILQMLLGSFWFGVIFNFRYNSGPPPTPPLVTQHLRTTVATAVKTAVVTAVATAAWTTVTKGRRDSCLDSRLDGRPSGWPSCCTSPVASPNPPPFPRSPARTPPASQACVFNRRCSAVHLNRPPSGPLFDWKF